MLRPVAVAPKRMQDYVPVVGEEIVEEIRGLAEPFRGARVLHVNSTGFGGGVAELLATIVPLMRDIGLDARWEVIHGADEFFDVTKALHNALQGMDVGWNARMEQVWRHYNQANAARFDEDFDFVIVHDPQPAGILAVLEDQGERGLSRHWVWRCHIDLTAARPEVWGFLRPYLERYDGAIFTLSEYVKPDFSIPCLAILPPSIDPLSDKNRDLSEQEVGDVLVRYKVDPQRPLLTQVSRFDPWKDPLGVIDVYRLVKEEVPELQLALVASMAADDPEGYAYFERTARHAGEDTDIYLLTNLSGVGNLEVNAIQRASDVIVQKSLREGFGLTVSEGLWKGRPVVGGNVGGIPLQVVEGKTGFLVNSVEQCAERVLELLRHPGLATEMGRAGREHVRRNFLSTRHLRHYLSLFHRLEGNGSGAEG